MTEGQCIDCGNALDKANSKRCFSCREEKKVEKARKVIEEHGEQPRTGKQVITDKNKSGREKIESEKPSITLSNADDIKGIVREEISKAITESGDDTLQKIEQYAPKILTLIKGFADGMKQYQGQKVEQQKKTRTPQPPPHYGTLKALTYKDDPTWQEQAQEWERYQSQMKAGKYSQGPLEVQEMREDPRVRRQTLSQHPEMPKQDDSKFPVVENEVKREPTKEEIEMAVFQQNIMKIIQMVNEIDDDKFREQIKDMKGLKEKAVSTKSLWSVFININFLKDLTVDDIEKIFKQNLPDKYFIIKEEKKVKEAREVISELQQELFKEEKPSEKGDEDVEHDNSNTQASDAEGTEKSEAGDTSDIQEKPDNNG